MDTYDGRKINKLTKRSTTMDKIFEKNTSFHVK